MSKLRRWRMSKRYRCYVPRDELVSGFRVRVLRAIWFHDWIEHADILIAGDFSSDPLERNSLSVILGRLTRDRLIEKREGTSLDRSSRTIGVRWYRITARGRRWLKVEMRRVFALAPEPRAKRIARAA